MLLEDLIVEGDDEGEGESDGEGEGGIQVNTVTPERTDFVTNRHGNQLTW